MKIFNVEITEEIKNILEKGIINENTYKLPDIQLDRKMYLEVNKVLELLGGKWNRSMKLHLFNTAEIASSLQEVLDNGVIIDKKKTFQFFATPNLISKRLVELADIKEKDVVLEPSAGFGSIVKEILKVHTPCYAIEIQEENRNILETIEGIKIIAKDFLEYEQNLRFDKIIMNPPFTGGQDADHILKAYSVLKKGGRIVSIVPYSTHTKEQKKYKELQNLIDEIIDLPELSFEESGTKVSTKIILINKL